MSSRTLLLLVGIVCLVVFQPVVWRWAERQVVRWHEQRSHLEQADEIRRRGHVLLNSLAALPGLTSQLVAVVPGQSDVSFLLEELERAAGNVRVAMTVNSMGEAAPLEVGQSPLLILPITVTITGQGAALLNYLQVIEQLPQLAAVRSFELTAIKDGVGGAGDYTAKMDMVFYLQGYGAD